MADVILKCLECGKENKISEYASPETRICASCHHALQIPEQEKKSARLQMRRIENRQAETLTGGIADYVLDEKVRREFSHTAADVLSDIHKMRKKVKHPHAFWGYLTFLIASGILIGLQYQMKQHPDLIQTYELVRIGISAIGAILLLIAAFQDNTFQGLLCLFVLPYAIYYVAVRLESYWLRGILLGIIVALCAELYFIPSQAFAMRAQQNTAIFIENTSHFITKASGRPNISR